MTKFGGDKSDILDARWGKKAAQTTPGPGDYGRFSEFTNDIKWYQPAINTVNQVKLFMTENDKRLYVIAALKLLNLIFFVC